MKIQNDLIEALKQQQKAEQDKAKPDTGKFGELLSGELQKGEETAGGPRAAAPPPGARAYGAGALLNVDQIASVESVNQSEQAVMQNIEHLLEQWEDYAQSLSSPAGEQGLRRAYGVLQHISSGVEGIKDANPDLGEQNPALQTMVDELEILTVTEQYKFNRGDYL
jgi:hypothetical protein